MAMGILKMKVQGELLVMMGIELTNESDQKFNCKVPSGYDTKIGPHMGSDVVKISEDF